MQVEIVEFPKILVAVVEHIGPPEKEHESVRKLIAWKLANGMVDPLKHRDGGVHMRASWIFSRNDVIANVGVILGGGLVYATGIRWPDLIVGIAIACIVFRGALTIIEDARKEQSRIVATQAID